MLRLVKMIVFIFGFIGFSSSWADTHQAASCSITDVQAAINLSSNGDTVKIPSGVCTWTSGLTLSKAITLQGEGRDLTFIQGSGITFISWEVGHNLPTRVTGITFDGLNGNGIALQIKTNMERRKNTSFRVDHCRFLNIHTGLKFLPGSLVYGVVDNNLFDNCLRGIALYGDGTASWMRGGSFGTADALYIENNDFYWSTTGADHAIEAAQGARYVFRYNTLTTNQSTSVSKPYDPVDAHGYCSNGYEDGTYLIEIYENKFIATGNGKFGRMVHMRGGRGVIFNNVYIGPINEPTSWITLTEYRAGGLHGTCLSFGTPPPGAPATTSDCRTSEGHPCWRQINNTYIWNNTRNGTVYGPAVANYVSSGYITENVDYWTTPIPGYIPYPFPHPLTLTSRPEPPKNLKLEK